MTAATVQVPTKRDAASGATPGQRSLYSFVSKAPIPEPLPHSESHANSVSINSPFRYAGGKFYARDLILEHVPSHVCYVEPMCGGGSIFFAKPKVRRSILSDIDEDLINCLTCIRDRPEELSDLLPRETPTKELHRYFKNEFKPTTTLERAARWYYLNRISYSGIMKMENCYFGYGDKYSMQPKNWRRNLLRTSAKLQGVEIYNQDFEKTIREAPDGAMLFLDPPYFNRDQDKFYTHTFKKTDHTRLMELLREHQDRLRFLLTYDNEQEIRGAYSWATEILEKEWNYTIYRTDDQSKTGSGGDKRHSGRRYPGRELFILNYRSPASETANREMVRHPFLGRAP